MTRLELIGAAVVLSTAVAGPALAQEVYTYGPAPYAAPIVGPPPVVYRSYGQIDPDMLPPQNKEEYWNLVNHGFTGRSPSRVGGADPDLTPPGN